MKHISSIYETICPDWLNDWLNEWLTEGMADWLSDWMNDSLEIEDQSWKAEIFTIVLWCDEVARQDGLLGNSTRKRGKIVKNVCTQLFCLRFECLTFVHVWRSLWEFSWVANACQRFNKRKVYSSVSRFFNIQCTMHIFLSRSAEQNDSISSFHVRVYLVERSSHKKGGDDIGKGYFLTGKDTLSVVSSTALVIKGPWLDRKDN